MLTNSRSKLLGGGRLPVPVPALGAELFTTANAASDPNGNEANGTDNLFSFNSTVTADADAAVGSYAIKVVSTGATGQAYTNLTPLETWMQLTFRAKRGAQGTGQTMSFANVSAPAVTIAAGGYASYLLTIRTQTTTPRRVRWLAGGTVGDVLFVDNISFKPITLASMFSTRPFSTHVTVKAQATVVAGTRAGVVCNLDSATAPANFVIASHDRTTARLTVCVAGVYTEKISTAVAYSAGAYVEIRRLAGTNTYQLWYAGAQVGADQTIADATVISNTLAGYFQTYAGNTLTGFSCVPS